MSNSKHFMWNARALLPNKCGRCFFFRVLGLAQFMLLMQLDG